MVVQVQPDQSARVAELRAQIDAVRSRKAALVARISRLEQQLMTKDIGDPLANVAQESGALAAERTAPHIPQTEGFWKDTQAPGPLGVITQKLRGNPSDFSPADLAIATPTILAGMGPEAQKFYANVVRGLASAPTGMVAMIESNPLPGLIEWVERMAKTTAGAFEMASTGIPSPNNQAAIDETKKALYEAPVEEIGMILGLIGGLKGGAKLISKGVKPHVDIPDLQPEGTYTPGQAKSLIQEQSAHTRQAPDMPEVKPPDLGTLNNWRDELVQLGYDPARVAAMDRLEMEFYLTGGRSGRLPAPKPKPAPKIESAEAPRPVEPPIEQKPLDVPTERPKVVEPSKAPIVPVQPKPAQTEIVIPPPETRPTPPPVRPEQVAPVSPETVPPRPIEPPAPPPEPPKPVEPPPKPPRTEPVSQTEIQAVLDEMGPTDKAKYATELVQLTEKYARKPAQLDKELIAWYERAQGAPKIPPKPVEPPKVETGAESGVQGAEIGVEKGAVEPNLTYEAWEKQYRSAFNEMNKYTPDEVGSSHFAEQMAKLADDYPEYVERLEKSQEPPPKPTEPQAGELTKFKVGDEVDFMVLGKEKTGVITGVEKVGNEFNDRTESVVLVKDADGTIHRQSEIDLLPREAPVGKTDLAPSIAPETAPLETKFNRLGEVPRPKIYTDESRFQNRDKGKVAEESRQNVRENFDPNNFDPIVVWEDPKRPGEHVVLSGHSRLAGLDDRGHKGNIPVRFFEGTEEQAIQYAREYANRSGTKESLSADVRAYQSMVDRGATQKEIQATFKSQSKFLDAIRHLDPNGKFMEIMGQDNVEVGFTDIKKFARWIGELRKDYPDKFTNRHEKQLFEHFYVDDNKGKNRQILKEDFDNLVARQITDFDWNPNGPLILERGQEVITGTKARFDTRAAEARIEELKERWREAETLGEKEALAAQIDKLRQRIKEAVRDQTDMFGMLGDPDAPMGAGRSKRTSEAHQMDPAQERVAKDQIIRFFEKSLGIPIRTGRFNQRAHGIFKPMVDVIRSRVWGNLPTITHEIGHFLEETKFGGFGPNSRLPQFPDLYQLGYDLYGRRKPHNGYYSEGFAEYLAHRMVGNNVAVIAPDFHPYFEQMLRNDPKLKKILAEGQEMTTRWFAQGAANRVRMMREHSSFADRLAQFRDRFSRDNFAKSLARFRDLWTQPEASIVLAESEMRGISAMDVMNPEKTRPTSSAGQQYRANAFAAQAQARSFVNHGVFDYNGKVTFPSLKEVLRPVARQIDNFWDYAISRYTLDLRKRGINSGVDPLDARYMVDKLESPEFRKALDDITEWQGQVLRYLVDAGGLSETAYQAIRDLNPIHVPLKRIIDLRKGVPGTGQKMGDIGSPVKTLKGSGRIIRDPLEAIIEQTAQIISTANRIRVGRALAELAEKSYGSGKWMERLPMPKRVTTFALEEISRELQKAGMDITDADLGQIASIYRNTRQGVPAENIITIWRDGDIQIWQLDKNLYSSLMNLDGVSQTMFLRFMSAPAKLKRMLITGLNPEFALTTNPIRDAFTFAAQTKYSKLAPLSAFEGFFRRFFPDEVNRLYNRSGADMGQIMQMDKHGLKEAVGEVLANTKMAQALNIAKHPVDILRELLSITESGPRRAEFKAAYKSLSKKYGEGADARIGATVASKDVTVDFSRMGKYAQYVNSLVPFFNAAIQGASKFGRTIKSNPIRSTAYGASMTAVSMAIWNEQKDEPWYRALPAWRKYGFWNIPVGTHEDGSVKIMSLPIPFEWGIVFKALPEAFLNAHYEKDPVAVKEFIQTVGTQTMPSLIPTAAQPIIEDQTNYDLFRNRQIVPQWMVESRVPEDQFFESTPQTYRELGERLGYSPAKLQHGVESLTGTFPTKVMRMIEGDTRSGQMDQPADLPVVGRLFPYQPNKEKREEADKESWERTKSRVTVLLGGGHYDEAKLAVEAWAFKHKDQEAKEVAIQLERIKSERASHITQRRQAAKLKK